MADNYSFSPFPEPFSEPPAELPPKQEDFPSMGWSEYKEKTEKKTEGEAVKPPEEEAEEKTADFGGEQLINRKVRIAWSLGIVIVAALMVLSWTALNRLPGKEKSADPDLIAAAVGGAVNFVDPATGAIAEVIIPAGALRQDTRVQIEKVSNGTVTDLFHLMPDGLKFSKPVAVVIPYKQNGLAGGQNPGEIKLQYWFSNEGSKRNIGFTVDSQSKKLRATVTQF